jgi:DNA-binding transcriptional MocR family regulator
MPMSHDPSFYAAPKLAMAAPPENFAYTLLLSPDLSEPDALAVIDVKPGSPIFEDDIYGRLPREAPQPLGAIVPELTYCIVSLAKCLMPGLRIAYCVAPNSSTARLAAAIRATSLMAPPLMSSLVTQWIGDGRAEQMLHCALYEKRRRCVSALPARC